MTDEERAAILMWIKWASFVISFTFFGLIYAVSEVDRLRAQVSQLTNANAHLQQEVNFLRRPE